MPFDSFTKFVAGFTSDHTPQSATIISYTTDDKRLELTGMTWNLLNKAHSITGDYKHPNNPFDIDELEEDYLRRKDKQLKFLWQLIEHSPLDFIALQEVDVFTRDPLPSQVKEFLEKIRSKGWLIVHTEKTDNIKQPLLILYHTKRLSFDLKRAVFPTHAGDKMTALEATFKYIGTTAQVCITNMHLDFDTDHRQAILDYQQQQITASKFTIIAGDANPSPGRPPYGLAGSANEYTNISKPLGDQVPTDEGGMFLQHSDGFMAGPAHTNERVEIVEGWGGYFKWRRAGVIARTLNRAKKGPEASLGKYIVKFFDPKKERTSHVVHKSLEGLPWIRDQFKHLVVN